MINCVNVHGSWILAPVFSGSCLRLTLQPFIGSILCYLFKNSTAETCYFIHGKILGTRLALLFLLTIGKTKYVK